MLRARVPSIRYSATQALTRRGPRPTQLARYSTPAEHPHARISGWRRALQAIGRLTIGTVIVAGAGFYYVAHQERTPGPQLPHDPTKKTLVVLGSGWGATSFLKKLDTTDYNVVVISPHNYFLFTPLLPSVSTGTLSPKSIISSTRYITRHKTREVAVIEAEAKSIDATNKTVTFSDSSDIKGAVSTTTIPYDYLIYAVGAETQTFGIPGVKEHACFMKELQDAEKMQDRFLDCVESAGFPGQGLEEIDRLLHMVVVGGGPTGIELSGELHDFLEEDLKFWYPELASRMKITLVEALPSVLPMFSKALIEYTESTFKEAKIDILTKTMVKEIKEKSVILQMPDKSIKEVPCGMVVWAAGNTLRTLTKDLIAQFPSVQANRRGLVVDGHLRVVGADSVFALGDCTATTYAPTAQVASQQGAYLAKFFNRLAKKENLIVEKQLLEIPEIPEDKKAEVTTKLGTIGKQLEKLENPRPFQYSHQGSLAYIGSEKAIADLPFMNGTFATGGLTTYYFWRSAYLSTLFSVRNRTLVATDWIKVKLFGRDVSRDS